MLWECSEGHRWESSAYSIKMEHGVVNVQLKEMLINEGERLKRCI